MKKILLGLGIASALALGALFVTQEASANPLAFAQPSATSLASTTISYLTPGAGTTTLVYDSYATSTITTPDRASLLVQFTATSTASILNISFEYSQDGQDWYADNYNSAVGTTTTVTLNQPIRYTWTFASSTPGGSIGSAFVNTVGKVINVNTPTRYTRAVFSDTGAGAGVYAAFIPLKQRAE